MSNERTGIFFLRDRNTMIRTFGSYLGNKLYDLANSQRELNKRLNIPSKSYHKFYISNGYLMVD